MTKEAAAEQEGADEHDAESAGARRLAPALTDNGRARMTDLPTTADDWPFSGSEHVSDVSSAGSSSSTDRSCGEDSARGGPRR